MMVSEHGSDGFGAGGRGVWLTLIGLYQGQKACFGWTAFITSTFQGIGSEPMPRLGRLRRTLWRKPYNDIVVYSELSR